jgi:signal transduction histidine kinase
MAHELNQPLTAILGQSQAGLRLLRRPDPDLARINLVLDANVAQAKRASAILARLREWSSRAARQPSPVSVNECLTNVVALVKPDAAQSSINLELNADPANPRIMADAVEIEQLVFNLMRNSIESLQRVDGEQSGQVLQLVDINSGTVQSDAFNRSLDSRGVVRISSRLTGDRVTIEVFDNGPGISPDMQNRLFEPFATDKPNGMGLGLALCTRIVERSAGSLSIVSDPHIGTRATVSIPVLEA